MVKTTLIVVATAIPAFGAGFWAEATFADHQRTESKVVGIPSTISPSELHHKVKLSDLPVQYMEGDFN